MGIEQLAVENELHPLAGEEWYRLQWAEGPTESGLGEALGKAEACIAAFSGLARLFTADIELLIRNNQSAMHARDRHAMGIALLQVGGEAAAILQRVAGAAGLDPAISDSIKIADSATVVALGLARILVFDVNTVDHNDACTDKFHVMTTCDRHALGVALVEQIEKAEIELDGARETVALKAE